MAEGKTNMFGKTYNTIGSTDSNFIIKTKGDLKIQWGNKFIDVIKNGKIANSGVNLLKQVQSKEAISEDGIYVLQDDTVCISIGGRIIELPNNSGTSYVSYLEEQETTPEQKYQALQNIGFIYNSINDIQQLQSGIVYITEKNKLYTIINGSLQEYPIINSIDSKSNSEELVLGDLKIYNNSGNSKIDGTTSIQLLINDNLYMSMEQGLIKINKDIVINNDYCLQSENAASQNGYKLYIDNDKSTLEIDNLIWRDMTFIKNQEGQYPKYDYSMSIPEEVADTIYNQSIPNIEWVKKLLNILIPPGTIVMWSGTEIPEGWIICDGNNGTPNLIGKFIKADSVVKENNPNGVSIVDGFNTIKLTKENLPEHSHPHEPHSHQINEMTGQTNSVSVLSGYEEQTAVQNVQGESITISEGYSGDNTSEGTHSHSITINGGSTQETESKEKEQTWENTPVVVEPCSYSLIFIMKTKTFTESSIEG